MWHDPKLVSRNFSYFSFSTILGLCPESLFDVQFGYVTNDDEEYIIRGFSKSLIEIPDTFQSKWKIKSYNDSSVYAILKDTTSLAIGNSEWMIYNDKCKYDDLEQDANEVQTTTLSLSRCNFNEFNCLDGTW